MPRVVPLKRTFEKNVIWNRYQEPIGFKFYVTFKKTRTSQPEHGEYSVIVTRRMNPRVMGHCVRSTIRRMVFDKELPPEVDYKTYDGFMRLFGEDWQPIHKVMYYNVQHSRT